MVGHVKVVTKQMHDFPPNDTNILAATERFIAYGKMFPVLHVIQEDGTLLSKVPETFIRDFMLDSSAVGWVEELRGSPPKLVIKILRMSDLYNVPVEQD